MNNKKSMSKEVYSHITGVMKEDLHQDIQSLNDSLLMKNLDFIESLIDSGISISALSKINIDKYKENIDTIKKENYKFPSFINIGELKNWHSTPSKIIGNEVFNTTSPFILPIENTSIGFIQNQKYKTEITNTMETIVLKLMSALPINLTRVSIIDKTGSGQNFPNLIRLHDKFTSDKIISDDIEIETELEDIKNSMSSITGSITSNGFTSIEDYNNNTDEIAQSYKIIAISNFPIGFSKKASESLLSIIESGYKAGIYVVMNFAIDLKHGYSQPIAGLSLNDFLKQMISFEFSDKPHEYTKRGYLKENINMLSVPYPKETAIIELLNNDFKIDFERTEKTVFDSLLKELNTRISEINIKPIIEIEKTVPKELWTGEAGEGVAIQFAKNGIENIFLSLGVNQFGESEGTYHGIIGGSTGSGKTVLLHDIILHGSMKYSPKELQFWLLDYKEGTEFATYVDYPHVNILSMESEVEFGQEVLQNVIDQIKERGRLFKAVGAENLKAYNDKVEEDKRLPRTLIIIDEFQVLFPRNPKVTAKTNDLINFVLRQGRSFGFNLLLSTQTLKGIDMDPQLMSNMPLRIGLKMDKNDVSKLFNENNTAVKFLEDPGEGIYNKLFGQSTANVNFQAYKAVSNTIKNIKKIVLDKIDKEFSEEDKRKLNESRFIYNGEKAGDLKGNKIYQEKISKNEKFDNMEFFIGEYAGLTKEHAKFKFEREYGENMLIVGEGMERVAKLFKFVIKQLAYNKTQTKVILHNFNKKNDFIFEDIRYDNFEKHMNRTHAESLNNIWKEYLARKELNEEEINEKERIVNFVFFPEGSTEFNSNDYQKESPIFKLKKLINEGSELGIHIVIYMSNVNTLSTLDLVRDIDKFKKKIGTGSGNYDKIFGDLISDYNESKSKFVMTAASGEPGTGLFKFKDYGDI